MSKKEILAWSSLGMTAAVLGYYLIAVLGLPQSVSGYADALQGLFVRVIVITFVIEVALEIVRETKIGWVEVDERDAVIAGKAYRNAYVFLSVGVVAVLGHAFLSEFVEAASGAELLLAAPFATVHALLILLLLASMLNSATRLYFYRTGVAYGSV